MLCGYNTLIETFVFMKRHYKSVLLFSPALVTSKRVLKSEVSTWLHLGIYILSNQVRKGPVVLQGRQSTLKTQKMCVCEADSVNGKLQRK